MPADKIRENILKALRHFQKMLALQRIQGNNKNSNATSTQTPLDVAEICCKVVEKLVFC